MRQRITQLLVLLIVTGVILSACAPGLASQPTQPIPVSGNTPVPTTGGPGGMMQGTSIPGMMQGTGMPMMEEHPTPPAPYKGKTDPLAGNPEAAAAGKIIYDQDCASCHGATGNGDGPVAASLNPKPSVLSQMKDDPDDYFFWRISEGGNMPSFHSAMPAWKNQLNEEQIWQVITYIRSLQK